MLLVVFVLSVSLQVHCSGKMDEFDALHKETHVALVGIQMCRLTCMNTAGCKSYNYHRLQLKCTLLSYTGGTKINTSTWRTSGFCPFSGPPLSTSVIVNSGNKRVCVYREARKALAKKEIIAKKKLLTTRVPVLDNEYTKQRKTKKASDKTEFLVASHQYSSTYYTCVENTLFVIKGKVRKQGTTYKVIRISQFKSHRGLLSGMAAAPCPSNSRTHCLYYLYHDSTGRPELDLVHHHEPRVKFMEYNIKSPLQSSQLRCSDIDVTSRSDVLGLSIDSELNLYTLHNKTLYKFGNAEEGFTECTSVCRIDNDSHMKAMQLNDKGTQLSYITESQMLIYDVTKPRVTGTTVSLLKLFSNSLYCLDTRQRKVVIFQKNSLAVTLCSFSKRKPKCT